MQSRLEATGQQSAFTSLIEYKYTEESVFKEFIFMEKIYFALVDTPGLFASMIRNTIGISYVHVAIGLDADLKEAYSIGRRNPFIPVVAGFEQEHLAAIYSAFPTARYKVVSLECTGWQKAAIAAQLEECFENRFRYHYCVLGLPFLLMNIPFYQKRHYTCSSFIARLLADNGIDLFGKHFSLVTPRDFYELPQTEFVYEGTLEGFLSKEPDGYDFSQWESLYESKKHLQHRPVFGINVPHFLYNLSRK